MTARTHLFLALLQLLDSLLQLLHTPSVLLGVLCLRQLVAKLFDGVLHLAKLALGHVLVLLVLVLDLLGSIRVLERGLGLCLCARVCVFGGFSTRPCGDCFL